jgi:hypothetical protein
VPSYEVRGQDWNRIVEVHVRDVFPNVIRELIVEGRGLHMSFKSCEKHIYYGRRVNRNVRLISNPWYRREFIEEAQWVTSEWSKFGNVPEWGS